MNAAKLVTEFGTKLGISLSLGESGTCRVYFDDVVDFELSRDSLYIMAEIAPAYGREDAYARLLTANWLGAESDGACIGLDANRDAFALYAVFHGDVPYENFEERLILFIRALRYWKDWLTSSVLSNSDNSVVDTNTLGMLEV